MFPAWRNGSRLPAIALQSSDFITVIRKPSAPFRQPSRDVGFPVRKIEEPDYCMISVWEKCVTTVTAIPGFCRQRYVEINWQCCADRSRALWLPKIDLLKRRSGDLQCAAWASLVLTASGQQAAAAKEMPSRLPAEQRSRGYLQA
jgi:hypothetical protein